MKIAYLLKMYPRFSETFIVNEILELERRGVDVRIYSLRKPDDGRFHAKLAKVKANVVYLPEYPDKEPARVERAEAALALARPESYAAVRQQAEARGHEYAIKRFQQAAIIAAHLLAHPVDAIHAHFASSATRVAHTVNQLIGLPYSFTAHAKDIFHEEVRPDSLRSKIRGARFVVTVSDYNRQHLDGLMGDDAADVRRLYNGIDLRHFRPNGHKPAESNLILAVGRLVEKKGFDVLIRACALLRDWGTDFRCEIIGKGDQEATLLGLIDSLGLHGRVKLAGPKSQDGVRRAYRRAGLFALPCVIGSDGNRDGLPTVLLEGMACGLPVVTTPITGNPEIVDDGLNGRLVPPDDPHALALALDELLRRPDLRTAMSLEARAKVERCFDVRQNVAVLVDWLAEPAPLPIPAAPAAVPGGAA